ALPRRRARVAEVEPGQDEVRAAGQGALEAADGLVAVAARGELQPEVVLRLDAPRIERCGFAQELDAFVAEAAVGAREAEPFERQRMIGRTRQNQPRRRLDLGVALLPQLR